MQRRIFLILGLMLSLPVAAHANSIVVGNHDLLANTAGQEISLSMTGSDFYTDSNRYSFINGGLAPAPFVTHVFNDTGFAIPSANFAGSIWAGGQGGIVNTGGVPTTSPTDSGLRTGAGFITDGSPFTPQNDNGIYVTLTLSTVGVPAGVYSFSLNDNPNNPGAVTNLFNGLTEEFDPIPVPLTITNGTLTVMPEPASLVLGLFAAAAFAAVAIRSHRARKTA